MAPRLKYVVDTSVFTHLLHAAVREAFIARDGDMLVTKMARLERGFSAASAHDWKVLNNAVSSLCQTVDSEDRDYDRALAVQEMLASGGLKGRKPPDLLIAAAAERLGATVLHYDNDFALISTVTGQPHAWIVPKGSLARPT